MSQILAFRLQWNCGVTARRTLDRFSASLSSPRRGMTLYSSGRIRMMDPRPRPGVLELLAGATAVQCAHRNGSIIGDSAPKRGVSPTAARQHGTIVPVSDDRRSGVRGSRDAEDPLLLLVSMRKEYGALDIVVSKLRQS